MEKKALFNSTYLKLFSNLFFLLWQIFRMEILIFFLENFASFLKTMFEGPPIIWYFVKDTNLSPCAAKDNFLKAFHPQPI